jgi:hypothetical protein
MSSKSKTYRPTKSRFFVFVIVYKRSKVQKRRQRQVGAME